ncbi:MAG: ion transporter [Candidatus Krumholzibacteriia bacterium]
MSLKQIVESSDTRAGRAFDIVIQLLIVVSLVSFSLETLPDLSERTSRILRGIEVVTVAAFTAEYLLRLLVAGKRLKFVFSFFGLIDLIAILPFYLATGLDLRAVRVLRFIRIFRIFKMTRYGQAAQLFGTAFKMVKEELVLFFFVTLLLLYLSGTGIYYFEHDAQPEAFQSVFDGLWWGVVTLTTVGYGDAFPITLGGRVFTFFILMIGLGVVAVPTGLMASALSQARELALEEKGQE